MSIESRKQKLIQIAQQYPQLQMSEAEIEAVAQGGVLPNLPEEKQTRAACEAAKVVGIYRAYHIGFCVIHRPGDPIREPNKTKKYAERCAVPYGNLVNMFVDDANQILTVYAPWEGAVSIHDLKNLESLEQAPDYDVEPKHDYVWHRARQRCQHEEKVRRQWRETYPERFAAQLEARCPHLSGALGLAELLISKPRDARLQPYDSAPAKIVTRFRHDCTDYDCWLKKGADRLTASLRAHNNLLEILDFYQQHKEEIMALQGQSELLNPHVVLASYNHTELIKAVLFENEKRRIFATVTSQH